eukprot:5934985-Amphidinium_carterae.1
MAKLVPYMLAFRFYPVSNLLHLMNLVKVNLSACTVVSWGAAAALGSSDYRSTKKRNMKRHSYLTCPWRVLANFLCGILLLELPHPHFFTQVNSSKVSDLQQRCLLNGCTNSYFTRPPDDSSVEYIFTTHNSTHTHIHHARTHARTYPPTCQWIELLPLMVLSQGGILLLACILPDTYIRAQSQSRERGGVQLIELGDTIFAR